MKFQFYWNQLWSLFVHLLCLNCVYVFLQLIGKRNLQISNSIIFGNGQRKIKIHLNKKNEWSFLFRFTSYVQFLLVFTFLLSIITWLFINSTFYVETIGFLAVFLEALLGIPQFLHNFRLKSTKGMSVKMVYFLFNLNQIYLCFIFRFSCGHLVIYLKPFIV